MSKKNFLFESEKNYSINHGTKYKTTIMKFRQFCRKFIYIIHNLRNHFNALYSLALVNRFWCRLAIPLLWEDPFSIKYRPNISFHFLDTYFLLLNDSDKRILKETIFYEIDPNLKKPLFNY